MKKTIEKLSIIFVLFFIFLNPCYARHRIFWLDSYDLTNQWTAVLDTEIKSSLAGHDVELETFHMDTKRNKSESFKEMAAERAVLKIKQYKPDLVIASEDDASKYVVEPFFKDTEIPVVFCGVNNSAERYGYPYKNATGIIERDPLYKLIYFLNRFKTVETFGYLSEAGETGRINVSAYRTQTRFTCIPYYVHSMAEWQKFYHQAQNEVDILIIGNISAINDWKEDIAIKTISNESRIPTGTLLEFVAQYAFLGCVKLPTEQARWAADTALKILNGTPISHIPIAEPRNDKLIVNIKIAKILGITVPKSYIDKADRIIR